MYVAVGIPLVTPAAALIETPPTHTLSQPHPGGFTPQYSELQQLQDAYGAKGFTVLAFPCNQFGGQEPGSAAQVCEFAKSRFQVGTRTLEFVLGRGVVGDVIWSRRRPCVCACPRAPGIHPYP